MIAKMIISPGALSWLGQIVPPQTRISPYSTLGAVPGSEEDRERLLAAGIMETSETISKPFKEAVELLARVSSYCRIRLTTGGMQVEKSVFFDETKSVSLDPSPEGLVIRYPSFADTLLEDLQYFTGTSPIAHSDFSIEANPAEALTVAGLIDLTRFSHLGSYAQDEAPQAIFSIEPILDAVNTKSRTSRRLVSFVRNLSNVHSAMNQAVLNDCLTSLEAGGYAARSDDKWNLTGEAERMASNFWVIDDVVHMQSGAENQEKKLAFVQWMCLQSGLHDRLYLDINDGKVRMAVISAASLVENMKVALSVPPALF